MAYAFNLRTLGGRGEKITRGQPNQILSLQKKKKKKLQTLQRYTESKKKKRKNTNINQQKAGVTILISEKLTSEQKKITREVHHIMTKGSLYQEDILTVLNM